MESVFERKFILKNFEKYKDLFSRPDFFSGKFRHKDLIDEIEGKPFLLNQLKEEEVASDGCIILDAAISYPQYRPAINLYNLSLDLQEVVLLIQNDIIELGNEVIKYYTTPLSRARRSLKKLWKKRSDILMPNQIYAPLADGKILKLNFKGPTIPDAAVKTWQNCCDKYANPSDKKELTLEIDWANEIYVKGRNIAFDCVFGDFLTTVKDEFYSSNRIMNEVFGYEHEDFDVLFKGVEAEAVKE